MCKRILMNATATYRGDVFGMISIDSRCAMNGSTNEDLMAHIVSFQNSDKPGVMIHSKTILATEFTDEIPANALRIDYVEPTEAPTE